MINLIIILACLTVCNPSKSYVGTEATYHEMDDTMVLNLSHNDDNFKLYTVVHEFGHALGLGHMHQSSHLAKALDEHLTIEWLQKESGLSSEGAVQKCNADFKPYSGESTEESGQFDASSVMCYPIDKSCFKIEGGLHQRDYDLITKTDDYTVRNKPSGADILTLQALYESSIPPERQLQLVKAQVGKFEHWFESLVISLEDELLEKVAGVKRLRRSITSLPVAIRPEHYHFVMKVLSDIKNMDIEDIFMHLNLYWTYLEYSLLCRIIESHSDIVSIDLKKAMGSYKEDIEVFKRNTTVEQLQQVGLGAIRREPPPGFTRHTVKLEKEVCKYTLQELDDIRHRTSGAFNLPEFILLLETVHQGSVCIVWHIPSSEVHRFMSASSEVIQQISSDLFHFQIHDSILYSTHTDLSRTLPQLTDFPGKTRHFNIASEIGTKYRIVGTALLNDESGVIIPAIVSKHKGNVEFINLEVLNQWVQGQGVKCSWLNLIHALRLPCSKLAEDIEESLSAEERSGELETPPTMTHKRELEATLDTAPPLAMKKSLASSEEYIAGSVYEKMPPTSMHRFVNPPYDIKVHVYYGSIPVHSCSFICQNGCRILYDPRYVQPPLGLEAEKMRKFVQLPQDHPDKHASIIFQAVRYGLLIELQDDDLYATPLCRVVVYSGSTSDGQSYKLEQKVRTKVFDYKNSFLPELEQYALMLGSCIPSPHVIFSLGQSWGPSRHVTQNLVSVVVTHLSAKNKLDSMERHQQLSALTPCEGSSTGPSEVSEQPSPLTIDDKCTAEHIDLNVPQQPFPSVC